MDETQGLLSALQETFAGKISECVKLAQTV